MNSKSSLPFYLAKLQGELGLRKKRNFRYSVRAFARSLGIDVGTVSRLLNGKQLPTEKMAARICQKLGLEVEEQSLFFSSVDEFRRAGPHRKVGEFVALLGARRPQAKLDIECYRVISDWYHPAILELTYVEEFQPDPVWIACELGITLAEAKAAIRRLLKLGLLVAEGGTLKKSEAQLTTTDKSKTTPALRKHQKDLLTKAVESLEKDPIDRRSVTSMVMAIDPERLPMAREMISRFNRRLCRVLESGHRGKVYNLEVALYPLQKRDDQKASQARRIR